MQYIVEELILSHGVESLRLHRGYVILGVGRLNGCTRCWYKRPANAHSFSGGVLVQFKVDSGYGYVEDHWIYIGTAIGECPDGAGGTCQTPYHVFYRETPDLVVTDASSPAPPRVLDIDGRPT